MSEQKMPALPDHDDLGMEHGSQCWNRATVARIQREAYEAGRQHERERLEPLRVAVEAEARARKALNSADDGGEDLWAYRNRLRTAQDYVMYAVNDLLEQTE